LNPKQLLLAYCGVFFVKLLMLAHFSHISACVSPESMSGLLAIQGGDTFSYLGAIDNYIDQGSYYFLNNLGDRVVAGRMPHYGALYYVIRLVASKGPASDLLVLFQVALDALAIVVLAVLAERMLARRAAFWSVIVLGTSSLLVTFEAVRLIPESLSVSFLVFLLWYVNAFVRKPSIRNALLGGVFYAAVVVLKPYLGLLGIPLGYMVLWPAISRPRSPGSLPRFFRNSLALGLPLCLFVAPWAIRNYSVVGGFVPLQINTTAGYAYSDTEFAYRRFVTAWGGSALYWDTKGAGCYFQPRPEVPCQFTLPKHALAPGYGADDVQQVRDLWIVAQNRPDSASEAKATARFDQLASMYRASRPVDYYLISPVRLFKTAVLHSGSWYWPARPGSPCYAAYQLLLRLAQSGLYYLVLLAGIVGLPLLAGRDPLRLFLLFIPVMLFVLFCVVIRMPESRYFNHGYPVLLLSVAGLAARVSARFSSRERRGD
jgi:hypothetical protein